MTHKEESKLRKCYWSWKGRVRSTGHPWTGEKQKALLCGGDGEGEDIARHYMGHFLLSDCGAVSTWI